MSDKTRDRTSLDFEGHKTIPEHRFVDCFKDTGHMHAEILHLVYDLWSMNLGWHHKLILREENVVSTDPIFFMLLFFTYNFLCFYVGQSSVIC